MSVATAGALAWLILFYPGFMSADSASQLLEARQGTLSDWHPPIMATMWTLFERVVVGPFGMLLLQTACFWCGLALLAERLSAPAGLKVAFMVGVGFAPPIVAIAGAIWKDVLMAAFLVLAFGLAGGGRAFWGFALLATLTRHNAILAVAGAVVLRFSLTGPSLAGLGRAAVATMALFAAALGVNAALAERRAPTVQGFTLFDLVGIAATTRMMPDLHPCFLRSEPLDVDAVLRSYDPRSTIPLVSAGSELHYCFDPDATSTLVRQWVATIARHPVAYLTHRLRVSGHVLGIGDTPGTFIMTRSTYTQADFPDLEPPMPQSRLQLRLEQVLFSMKSYGVFRPWPYAVLAIIACAVAVRDRLWWPSCIALSALAHQVGLLFVAPAEDYRYSFWMIVGAIIAAVWVVVHAVEARASQRA